MSSVAKPHPVLNADAVLSEHEAIQVVKKKYTGLKEAAHEHQRVAHLLDFCAVHCPGSFLTWAAVMMVVRDAPRKPTAKSPELQLFQDRMRRNVPGYLRDNYGGRVMVALAGMGVRASVDDTDKMGIPMEQRVRRLNAASAHFRSLVDTIKPASLPPVMRSWHAAYADAAKQLASPAMEQKLLTPSARTDLLDRSNEGDKD